ncbi:MAG TPA: LamG domain-containing protein, partial [Acidimicrobiia bacterium]
MAFPVNGYADLDAAIADGMLHYWPLDEAEGWDCHDYIGGLHGTASLSAYDAEDTIIQGLFGNARQLYRTSPTISSGRIEFLIPYEESGPLIPEWTMVARIYPFDPPAAASGWPIVLGFHWNVWSGSNPFEGEGYCHVYYGGSNGGDPDRMLFEIWWDAQTSTLHELDVPAPARDQWHTLAMVCDPQEGETRCYIDGTLVGTINAAPPVPFNSTAQISGNNPFRGAVDDIGIWSRALTAQEVSDAHATALVDDLTETTRVTA